MEGTKAVVEVVQNSPKRSNAAWFSSRLARKEATSLAQLLALSSFHFLSLSIAMYASLALY